MDFNPHGGFPDPISSRSGGDSFATGGPSYGIPILVALAVFAAFGMIAVLLDQLVQRGVRAPTLSVPGEPAPAVEGHAPVMAQRTYGHSADQKEGRSRWA